MSASQFQSFDDTTSLKDGAPHLARLIEELQRRDLDGSVVPRTYEHQHKYAPEGALRLAWLTGFTGSVVTCLGGLAQAG
jgi:Xaa-Pro aminopeptidase